MLFERKSSDEELQTISCLGRAGRPFPRQGYCPTLLCLSSIGPRAFVVCSSSKEYMLYVKAKEGKRSEIWCSREFSQLNVTLIIFRK